MACRRCWSAVVSLFVYVLLVGSSQARPVQPGASLAENDALSTLSNGTISGNTYTNPDLGIRYQFPANWTANDKPTQERAIAASRQVVWVDDSDPKRKRKEPDRCTKDLLLVTQYPEDMLTNEFNPLVQMIAADPRCSPGATFPATVKDLPAIQRIASQLGTYFKTASVNSRSASQIHGYDNAGQVILEVSQRLTVYTHEPGLNTVRELHTSVFIAQAGKYWLMWMLVGGDDGQLEKLRASKIFFDASRAN